MEYDGSRRELQDEQCGGGGLGDEVGMRMGAAGSYGRGGRCGSVVVVLGGLRSIGRRRRELAAERAGRREQEHGGKDQGEHGRGPAGLRVRQI